MSRWPGLARALDLASVLAPILAAGAPISFNTALPVAKGEFVFRELFLVSRAGKDSSPADRNVTGWSALSVLGYGATPKLALFSVLPYEDRTLDLAVAEQRFQRRASGLGDLSLFARYTAYQRDWPGRTLRLAPIAGFEAPTGEDGERDAFGRLPPPVQPGSGSWDAFGGVVGTYQTLRYQVDAQFLYRANTEAKGFEAGDLWNLDASLQYRLWPWRLETGTPAFLYGVIEGKLVHQDEDRVAGRKAPDSGGTRLFLTPGLQYLTRRWVLETAVQLPIFQDLLGAALKADYTVHTGFRFNF